MSTQSYTTVPYTTATTAVKTTVTIAAFSAIQKCSPPGILRATPADLELLVPVGEAIAREEAAELATKGVTEEVEVASETVLLMLLVVTVLFLMSLLVLMAMVLTTVPAMVVLLLRLVEWLVGWLVVRLMVVVLLELVVVLPAAWFFEGRRISLISPLPRGAGASRASCPWTVSKADISWPRPTLPSKPPTYHFWPQMVRLPLPEHALAAASAEASRSRWTVASSLGTMTDEAYMKRER